MEVRTQQTAPIQTVRVGAKVSAISRHPFADTHLLSPQQDCLIKLSRSLSNPSCLVTSKPKTITFIQKFIY